MYEPAYKCSAFDCGGRIRHDRFCDKCEVKISERWRILTNKIFGMSENEAVALMQEYAA